MLLAMFFVILAVLAAFLAIQAARLKARQRWSFRIYAAAFGVVFGYLLLEFPVTAHHGFSWAGTSFYLFDESTKTVHFDPIRGYRLSEQGSRWGHIVNGKVEFVAWLKGNSQGFPSRTDFVPARTDASTRRIAVFGDSFSSGDYLETNWPDRTQALAEAGGEKLQLLNFSLYGAGLANWWSILTRLVAPQNYELDGIVFVDFHNDLERKFLVPEYHGTRFSWRYCPSWDPQTYPTKIEQTSACLYTSELPILSDSEFEGALNKKWPPSIARWEVRPVLAKHIADYLDLWWRSKHKELPKPAGFDPGQARLIDDIRRFVSSRNLPVLVVFLPDEDRLVQSTWESDPYRPQAMAFAKQIGAKFVDGSGAFANMKPAEVRKYFFNNDPHWNQTGSDRFAKFMLDVIPREFPKQLPATR